MRSHLDKPKLHRLCALSFYYVIRSPSVLSNLFLQPYENLKSTETLHKQNYKQNIPTTKKSNEKPSFLIVYRFTPLSTTNSPSHHDQSHKNNRYTISRKSRHNCRIEGRGRAN